MRSIAERLAYNRRNSRQLNPLLFNDLDELIPAIKDKILKIVDEFIEYIQVDIRIMDIRLVGSNAAYNYGEHSDLDIHIVTDLSEISDPETIARLYFDSVKKNFKDSYDIRIKGIEVELYIEDINASTMSNGIYSVLQDKWIKEPTPSVEPTSDQLDAAEEIESEIIQSIKSAKSTEELQSIVDNMYLMRKDSLSSDGETGAGNLAFKSLRNKGVLDKVKDVLRAATAKKLSLESKNLKESAPLKTLKGSVIKRSTKYGVGKEIGGQIYFHKDYVDRICPNLYELSLGLLEDNHPDFVYNCLMFDKKKPHTLRFDEAPDFDAAREPMPGMMISVDTETGEIIKRFSNQIWHHKWLWVMDDYKGFDVQESYEWSKKWLEKITAPSGYKDKWDAALKDAGLSESIVWLGGHPWDDDLFHENAEKLGLTVQKSIINVGGKPLEFDYVTLKRPTVFYHATTADRLESIQTTGLAPQVQAGDKYVSGVFLSGSSEASSKWRGSKSVVLEVTIPAGVRVYQDRQANAVFVREKIDPIHIKVL